MLSELKRTPLFVQCFLLAKLLRACPSSLCICVRVEGPEAQGCPAPCHPLVAGLLAKPQFSNLTLSSWIGMEAFDRRGHCLFRVQDRKSKSQSSWAMSGAWDFPLEYK